MRSPRVAFCLVGIVGVALSGCAGKKSGEAVSSSQNESGAVLGEDSVYPSYLPAGYAGQPFEDSKYKGGAQKIPGIVMCAYYDFGGEGVAYHDNTPTNQGSGGLNPLNGDYYNEFRHDEAVDTSYTKYGIGADNSAYNVVTPVDKLLYVGWTEPGEWFNLTVDVAETGTYTVNIFYTSNRGGAISLDVNEKPAGGPIRIVSTFNAADPVAWRQWHHWNLMKDAAAVKLLRGRNLLTVHIVDRGNMNLATLEFRLQGAGNN
jgi:hypothetical protein